MKICKPFKSATINSMTQGFWSGHQANDFASFYGDFLVAPFNAKVIVIRGVQNPQDIVVGDNSYLTGGCGIRLQSIEDPTLSMVYWHCQDVFPVKVGDTVVQGQIVAMEGNTGFVESNGVYVAIDTRLQPPYPGTHTHITIGRENAQGVYEAMDYHTMIDWSIPITYNATDTIKLLIQKIQNLLSGK